MRAVFRQSGFSLPEIIVVIAIIGILSSIGYAYFANAKAQARDRVRAAHLEELAVAIEAYKDQNGRYPEMGCSAVSGAVGNESGTQWAGSETYVPGDVVISCPSDYIKGLVAGGFVGKLPREITATGGYLYKTNTAGTRYKLLIRGNVEALTITDYSQPFARYPVASCVSGSPPFPSAQARYYAVYSDDVSACW